MLVQFDDTTYPIDTLADNLGYFAALRSSARAGLGQAVETGHLAHPRIDLMHPRTRGAARTRLGHRQDEAGAS